MSEPPSEGALAAACTRDERLAASSSRPGTAISTAFPSASCCMPMTQKEQLQVLTQGLRSFWWL
eukprot:CAMPEP_0206162348 /NCGR_PEP_ID=MMETSP1474-20131121/9597_1 /ASSEMBLY_ACC=CAM_ASM_001110 /TAXON_ID=97495 /ORGANISM="Imantonia sp., Strain RCC918" /LENGTH=63 /DNA_ID=CAMNT_0053564581 /DNA_START=160 /DNA_END=351 /DNA_ORIENTATION=+